MDTDAHLAPILVLIGPPGAGRATQARLLSKRLGRPRISTGDLLRELAVTDSPVGLEVRAAQYAGRLVDDDLVVRVVDERLSRDDCREGVVFHGFPATIAQARALDERTGDPADVRAIAIVAPHELLLDRLSGRRVCMRCGRVYNVFFSPPLVDGRCDDDGASVACRADDAEETVKARLIAYHNATAPLFGYYRSTGRLVEVDGDGTVEEVCQQIRGEVVSSQ